MYRHPTGKPEEKTFAVVITVAWESVEFCGGLE